METLLNQPAEPAADLGSQIRIEMPSRMRPLTIYAAAAVDCVEWAITYKNELNQLLLNHGAILLRGFNIGGAAGFNQLFSLICGDPIEYRNRTSPRDIIFGKKEIRKFSREGLDKGDRLESLHEKSSLAQRLGRPAGASDGAFPLECDHGAVGDLPVGSCLGRSLNW